MTDCPACHSEETIYWDELSSWRCTECSHVFDREDTSGPDVSLDDEASEEPKGQVEDWETQVVVKDKSEANLVEVLSQTEDIADRVGLSEEIVSRAAEIVTEAWESNFMHGRTKSSTVAAALYAATREAKQSVPPGVFADEVGSDKQATKKIYTQLKQEQQLSLDPPRPEEFLEYICTSLDLPKQVNEVAERLLTEQSPESGNPIGIAAAGVYNASSVVQDNLTFREIATCTHLTKETIWRQATQMDKGDEFLEYSIE